MIKLCILAMSAALYLPGIMSAASGIADVMKKEAVNAAVKADSIIEQKKALPLDGIVITIDAGHQQKGSSALEQVAPGSSEKKARVSSGTRGVSTGKYEYEINLLVAFKLRDKLKDKGASVYMVRESHDVDISNIERAQFANEKNSDISVRIHADGSDNSSVKGFSLLVPGDKHIKDTSVIESSKTAAKYMEQTIAEKTLAKSRGIVTRNDLTGFNWLKSPSVLVEMGFMSNPEEDRLLSDDAYQDKMAEGIAEGLTKYFESK